MELSKYKWIIATFGLFINLAYMVGLIFQSLYFLSLPSAVSKCGANQTSLTFISTLSEIDRVLINQGTISPYYQKAPNMNIGECFISLNNSRQNITTVRMYVKQFNKIKKVIYLNEGRVEYNIESIRYIGNYKNRTLHLDGKELTKDLIDEETDFSKESNCTLTIEYKKFEYTCSESKEYKSNWIKFYLVFIFMIIFVVCLIFYPDKRLYNVRLRIINLFELIGLNFDDKLRFCNLANSGEYKREVGSKVLVLSSIDPDLSFLECKYILKLKNKIYKIQDGSVVCQDIRGDIDWEINKHNNISHLVYVFWQIDSGVYCVNDTHCLGIKEISLTVHNGLFFKESVSDVPKIYYDPEEVFNVGILKKLSGKLFPEKMIEFCYHHNKMFFHEEGGCFSALLNLIRCKTYYSSKPEECKISQWIRYCSDLKYIGERFNVIIRVGSFKAKTKALLQTEEYFDHIDKVMKSFSEGYLNVIQIQKAISDFGKREIMIEEKREGKEREMQEVKNVYERTKNISQGSDQRCNDNFMSCLVINSDPLLLKKAVNFDKDRKLLRNTHEFLEGIKCKNSDASVLSLKKAFSKNSDLLKSHYSNHNSKWYSCINDSEFNSVMKSSSLEIMEIAHKKWIIENNKSTKFASKKDEKMANALKERILIKISKDIKLKTLFKFVENNMNVNNLNNDIEIATEILNCYKRKEEEITSYLKDFEKSSKEVLASCDEKFDDDILQIYKRNISIFSKRFSEGLDKLEKSYLEKEKEEKDSNNMLNPLRDIKFIIPNVDKDPELKSININKNKNKNKNRSNDDNNKDDKKNVYNKIKQNEFRPDQKKNSPLDLKDLSKMSFMCKNTRRKGGSPQNKSGRNKILKIKNNLIFPSDEMKLAAIQIRNKSYIKSSDCEDLLKKCKTKCNNIKVNNNSIKRCINNVCFYKIKRILVTLDSDDNNINYIGQIKKIKSIKKFDFDIDSERKNINRYVNNKEEIFNEIIRELPKHDFNRSKQERNISTEINKIKVVLEEVQERIRNAEIRLNSLNLQI